MGYYVNVLRNCLILRCASLISALYARISVAFVALGSVPSYGAFIRR